MSLMMKRMMTALMVLFLTSPLWATPSRIILLRHGEKENAYAPCATGQQRSLALKSQYLGNESQNSLFDQGPPAAFFATTLHTLELAAPAADSWGLPVITYSVVSLKGQSDADKTDWVTCQTRRAATEVMNNPRWRGQTIVMVWEHKHIANRKLVKDNAEQMIELRQLLKIDQLPEPYLIQVPKTWNGANYNFFWVIEYDADSQPISFNEIRQDFAGAYAQIPNNNWGVAEVMPPQSRCKPWE